MNRYRDGRAFADIAARCAVEARLRGEDRAEVHERAYLHYLADYRDYVATQSDLVKAGR